ncbi:MAG: hypothetical protein AB3K77_01730 [Methanosarcinaceae archaeon]|uniref:hypothetical protein n=1 Tax=Methanosarcina sp. MTP4 TaxID=1434100 RepID=UPI0012E05D9F|nr:hypothetical protein [Methanosarcina sp. MTP4]
MSVTGQLPALVVSYRQWQVSYRHMLLFCTFCPRLLFSTGRGKNRTPVLSTNPGGV